MVRNFKTLFPLLGVVLCVGVTASAHVLPEREFDFAAPYATPFNALSDMIEELSEVVPNQDQEAGGTPPAESEAAQAPAPAQPVLASEAVEILNTYNKGTADQGGARSPRFTLDEPMMLTYLQTYHWNDGQGMPRPGQIGIVGQGMWQAEGRPGMLDTPNVEWIATPNVVLPAGTYSVLTSAPETWAHNSFSDERGFVVVKAAKLANVARSQTPQLTERAALEALQADQELTDWVVAVRNNQNSVVYEVTSNPEASCTQQSCHWCFRMSEETQSYITYFRTYCVDALSGSISIGDD